ncbi:DUF6922 domain-containing protein [Lunatibacter salilacus]|uniref:DUF6922 domain-containing protein n=1 Tax=Lunatibacter salilacus TaxID=2483804 RepID=UPI003743A131
MLKQNQTFSTNCKVNSSARKIRLSDYFPNAISWEVDLNKLDYRKDIDFVISRVLDWGDYNNAWDNLELLYS